MCYSLIIKLYGERLKNMEVIGECEYETDFKEKSNYNFCYSNYGKNYSTIVYGLRQTAKMADEHGG